MNVNKSNFIKKYYDNRTEVNSILRVSLKIDSKEVHAVKYDSFDRYTGLECSTLKDILKFGPPSSQWQYFISLTGW